MTVRQPWKPNVTVAAIVERRGEFLLVEERGDDRPGTVFNQPAGHLEPGESLVEAVIRETLEETAWHFRPTALVGIYRWPKPGTALTYLRFAFTGELTAHEPQRALDPCIVATAWKTPGQIRAISSRLRSPQVIRGIEDYLKGGHVSLDILKDTPH